MLKKKTLSTQKKTSTPKKKPVNGTVRGRLSDGAPNPIDVHVGLRVKEARRLYNLSQEGLAEALGITFQQVQKYEKGQNRIGASRLWDLAQVFSVPTDFFYDKLDETTKRQSPRLICNPELREPTPDIMDDFVLTYSDRELVRLYHRIQNQQVAQAVLDLVKSVVSSESLTAGTGITPSDTDALADYPEFKDTDSAH